MKKFLNSLFSLLTFGVTLHFLCASELRAQGYPQNVDLKITLVTELPQNIKINGVFAVEARVELEANSSTIPNGEVVRARIELLDPDNIPIDSYEQTWETGFNSGTDGWLENNPSEVPNKVLFQIPWSQADKWTAEAEWKILIHVTAPSVETDLSDNRVERSFPIVVPDITPTIQSVSAVDPLSGELSLDYVPNTNYVVSGRVTNIGMVATQPGIYVPVVATLANANGTVLDEEVVLLGGTNQFDFITANGGAWDFTIDELFVPPTETGALTLSIEVNPDTMPGGPAQIEQSYTNNGATQTVDLSVSSESNANQRPRLQYVDNSYNGERGTFRGLDPAFISFAVRNSGRAPVGPNDYAVASIFLSKDLVVDKGDFVLREFNLSGDGIGLGLLAGDTVNLTWNQQLPDNYEGDFYLLIQIQNGYYDNKNTVNEVLQVTELFNTQLDTTPVFTLLSQDRGETRLLQTDLGESGDNLITQLTANARAIEQQRTAILIQKAQFPELGYAYDQQIILLDEEQNEIIAQINALASPAERPDSSKDGRFLVFEKKSPLGQGENASFPSQQIYLLDMMQPLLPPVLITREYGTNANPQPANGNSFRPRISYDGDTIVFHSISDNLVPGDTNNKEDVFVYRISTQTMFRAVNSNNDQFNGRSLYPDVNGDGTRIVFESDATNADLNNSREGSQIYLWTLDQNSSGSGYVRAITNGNGESYSPSIDDAGERVVFHSFATDLIGSGQDTNNHSDVFLVELNSQSNAYNDSFHEIVSYTDSSGSTKYQATFLASRSYKDEQATSGHSANAKISGNGERIIFESKATNLISGTGIALIEVTEGGGGYAGNPTIEIFDNPGDYNGSGAPGRGAELTLREGGINALSEIDKDAILIIDPGQGYVSPVVRIIPDPDYPEPTLPATAVAYLSSPEGDVYYVDVADLNGSNTLPTKSLYAHRVSQSTESSGGNFGSREPSIDWNGSTIVYSTKSNNLLASEKVRDDGISFFNSSFVLPKARAVLVGGIGEIEIQSYGMGYEPGALLIEDLSGSGSGAIASYDVDNLGRILSINIVDPGQNYNLDTTVVGIIEPRGGTGFEAGEIRFLPTLGEGATRQGGGRIFSVIMEEHGKGYFIGDSNNTFSDIIQFEGDGADLNQDGFPDGRLRPDRLKNLNGSLFIEQRFDVDVLNAGVDLENTTLTIFDKNNSNDPLIITFGSSGSNNVVSVTGRNANEIRDDIIDIIALQMEVVSGNSDSGIAPVIDQNLSGGTSFEFHALSGSFISSNPAAIQVKQQSNMLIMGSGYSTVTPVINQVPSIFGFSEVLSNPNIEVSDDVGRMTLLSAQDNQSDDIYLYDVSTAQNNRISTSTFGTPVMYLENPPGSAFPSPPSNRFPVISGNGRYVFFSSDAWGNEGLAFITSNQFPQDYNPARDIYLRDLKTMTITEEDVVSSVDILYPNNNLTHSFAPGSPIPIIADVDYSGVVGRLEIFVNQESRGDMEEFGGGLDSNYRSSRFTSSLENLPSGEYSLQLVAYGTDNQVLATSALIRFEVAAYEGSLPPVVSMRNPTSFSAITATSVIPISASAEDPDGTISSISYYVDGDLVKTINRFAGVSETEQSFAMLLDLNDTLEQGESQGFRTFFAIALDGSGNYVASELHNLSFTSGSTPPSIDITRGFNGFQLTEANDLNISRLTGGIIQDGDTSVVLKSGPVGSDLIAAKIIVSGSGSGAEIEPIIDLNISSSNYGKLTGFNVIDGGRNYTGNATFSIIPVLRSINEGVRAEMEYAYSPPEDINASSRTDTVTSARNPDGSLRLGSGYVISPRLRFLPTNQYLVGFDRLPLEPTDAPTSKLLPFTRPVTIDADSPIRGAELIGGFAQSPIFISVEVNATDELVESVSLVVNGEVDNELVNRFPDFGNTYNFRWIPGDPGDYSLAAIVRDFAGNIVSTEESTISVENYYGSGMNLNLGEVFDYEVEGNGQLFIQIDASSEFGILEVEFFIGNQFVGRQVSTGTTSFQQVVDLSDPAFNFTQGEHEISIIAYDAKGNIAGTFSRVLTSLQNRMNPRLNVLPPLIKNKPSISMAYPSEEIILTQGSSIRLSADANDSNGDLRGVQFYKVGTAMHAWSGMLDFDGNLPADGSTLTIFDGTAHLPVTFEFDDNDSVFGGGAPVAVPGFSNESNDLVVEGNFSYSKPVEFLVEIHKVGTNGSGDFYRWSLDGGATFVDEYVEISAPGASRPLAFGMAIKFTDANNHAIGDRWTFTGRPMHHIVRLEDVGSPLIDVKLTRDNLKTAIDYAASLDLLAIRSFTNSNYNRLYLAHTFEHLIEDDVDIIGSSLTTDGGTIFLSNNDLDGNGEPDNFILSQADDPINNQPFGITWEANATGTYLVFAIAEDSNGARANSASTIITVISPVGELPTVKLGPVERSMVYSGSAVTASLSAEAEDPDGTIAEVVFYANGMEVGSSTTRPFSASFEINATGHYEVYAIARDNSGNLVTSNVRRIIVDGGGGEPVQPLVLTASSAYLGGVGEISATYKSVSGAYDSNIRALIYVDGKYAGDADILPRTPPGPGEEDPGQGFTYDLPAQNLNGYEVRFIIINGDETASASTLIVVEQSPLSDDEEFLSDLYLGLYNRYPESFELGQFYGRLGEGVITRADVLKELRTRQEFTKARDILIAHKTLYGFWRKIGVVLDDIDPVVLAEREGINAVLPSSIRPDDGDIRQTATPISMNEVLNASIEEYGDDDWFTFQTLGPGLDGVLEVTAEVGESAGDIVYDIALYRAASNGAEEYVSGTYFSTGSFLGGFGFGGGWEVQYDLRGSTRPDITYYLVVRGSEFALGDYKLIVKNDVVLTRLRAQEELENIGKINSLINNYPITSTLGYLTSNHNYEDKYGSLNTHAPEEFFSRLFYNKYDQDPSPTQLLRGIEVLSTAEGNNTNLNFLTSFALDNKIVSSSSYNYTIDLGIPNVPLDLASFGETALIYNALIGEAPSNSEVAKITLTSDYKMRPMTERAQMIMEMPAYAARYGLAIPEIDLPNLRNGRTYTSGHELLIDAASLGPDNLGGTVDDGHIRELKILFNGEENPLWVWTPDSDYLVDSNISKDSFYYNFNIPDLPMGEYEVVVVAEDKNGLISRAQRNIYLGDSNETVALTSPMIDEVLDIDEIKNFKFDLSDPTMSAYLQINGRLPWIGHLEFNASNLPDDGSTVSITDGTNPAIIFEFDNDFSTASTNVDAPEKLYVAGDYNITTSTSNYLGTKYREYIIEIDGDDSGPNGHDTFRWSIDGGAHYNNSEIEIDSGVPSQLSAGIVVSFDHDTAYQLGDRWRIRAYAVNEIIEVGRYGSFADRLDATRKNLIDAINRVYNEGRLSLWAKISAVDSTSSGWFDSLNQNKYGIELRHMGTHPLRQKLDMDTSVSLAGNTTLSKSDWLSMPWKDSTSNASPTLSLDLRKLGFTQPMLEARVVAFDGQNNTVYSQPRAFTLRDPSRLSIELGDPVGRKASVRIVGDLSLGLTSSNFQVLDGGAGYTADTAELSIISEYGMGAALKPVINELGEVASVEVVSPGSGYTLSDLVLVSSPLQYVVGQSLSVAAKVRDPLSELDRVAFYVNGVELDANSTSGSGSTHSASYVFTDESAKFVTARALYGDERDLAPPAITEDEWMHGPGIAGDRINYWGWRRHWAEQHFHGPGYVFPEWFIQDHDYWALPPPWLSLPYGPGAIPVQVNAEPEKESISIAASSIVDMGQVGLLGLTYRSVDGDYDDDLKVSVYVDDQFVGYATMLEYEEPEFWEEDPGYKFEFVLPVHTSGTKEVEFYILDGVDTFTAFTTIKVEESPFTDDEEFIKSLYKGLFDREPEIAELGAIMGRLSSFEYNRNQIFEQLRLTQEFVKARNILLLRKTLFGRWDTVETALFDISPQQLAERDGINSVIPASQRPDDGDTHLTATRVEMNDIINGSLESRTDEDWFRVETSGDSSRDGVLEVFLETNNTTIANNNAFAVFADQAQPQMLNDLNPIEGEDLFNLTELNFETPDYYVISVSAVGGGLTKTDYTLTLRNQIILQNQQLENALDEIGKVDSPINEFQISETIDYLTGTFDYTNTYGSLRNESRENLFSRLFRNKYDQEANPIQLARGVELLRQYQIDEVVDDGEGNQTAELQFLQDFATENNIITVGGYNYTTSEAELSIPNVPIDAAAFAETALIYSALLGNAPSNAEVASLTLDPYFEVRPLAERAQMILDMPGYAAQYSVSIPRVDFLNVHNGMILDINDSIKVEAFDHGIDGISNTFDDGQIATVSLLLNGSPMEEKEGNLASNEYTFDFNQSATGEYDLEVVAHNVQGEMGRAHRRIFIGTRDSTISIDTPNHGAVLSKAAPADFTFSTENVDLSNGTGYLEINGKIRWSGAIEITDDLMLDESTLSFHDGTNRGAVSFEMDANESASSYEIHANTIRQSGEGNVTASGTYSGPAEGIEYWVIIDSNESTFKWMEEGAMEPNATAVAISTDINYTDLGYGIQVNFDSNDSYAYGDAWKIVVKPSTDLVEVDTEGSFEDRLARTKRNLITSINRANSEGLLALRAEDPMANNRIAGMLPVSMAVNRAVVLRHDGSYPITVDLNISTSAGGATIDDVQQGMFSFVEATGTYDANVSYETNKTRWELTLSDWDSLELCDGLLEVRLVHLSNNGNIIYSNKRAYPVVDPSRGYVELIGPLGTVYEPGRLPTVHFSETVSASGILPWKEHNDTTPIEDITIVDGGTGYRWYDEDSKQFTIVSSTGSGGNLQIKEINSSTEGISEVYAESNLTMGSGYHARDVIVPSPPAFFDKYQSIDLSARLHDPYSDYQRMAFYVNGIEVDSLVEDRSGGVFGTAFMPDLPGDKFITARALYGDSRDFGPSAPHTFGQYPCNHGNYGGKDHWGWKKSWLQQHYSTGHEFLPTWYKQHQNYWIHENNEWARQPMWDGSASVRIREKDVYESVIILINSASLALKSELLHSQSTQVSATAEWSEGGVPSFSEVNLYGNGIHLAQIDLGSTELESQVDVNVTSIDINQTLIGSADDWVNRIVWNFEWVVNYKQFKDEFGIVDLMVVATTEEGRQLTSGVKTARIRELDYNDPLSTAAMFFKDVTGKTPSDTDIDLLLPNVETNSLDNLIKSVVDYSNQGEYEFMADLIAAYKVLYGSNHSSSQAFFTQYEFWRDSIVANRGTGLSAYIQSEIQSTSYTSRYGAIPIDKQYFFGTAEGANLSNRKEFVTRHFRNKYNGKSPTTFQYLQGAKKMWDYAGGAAAANNYMMNLNAAVDFIYNLATEPIERVGVLGSVTRPYLNSMQSLRSSYLDKAEQYALSKADGVQETSEEAIQAADSSARRVLQAIVEDPNLKRRFNLLWEDSTKAEDFEFWKHEDWFGHFMDEKYPWIYHLDLGWLYSNGTSQKNIWFYSESMGWFWTNREIFKDHPNLTADNQRFIFRVRPRTTGSGYEGSWSLVTLPGQGSGTTAIQIYDYGYNAF